MKTESQRKIEHSTLPWHVAPIGALFIGIQDGRHIADMRRDYCDNDEELELCKANAAFIVKACNSHDALVEACKVALATWGHHDMTANGKSQDCKPPSSWLARRGNE